MIKFFDWAHTLCQHSFPSWQTCVIHFSTAKIFHAGSELNCSWKNKRTKQINFPLKNFVIFLFWNSSERVLWPGLFCELNNCSGFTKKKWFLFRELWTKSSWTDRVCTLHQFHFASNRTSRFVSYFGRANVHSVNYQSFEIAVKQNVLYWFRRANQTHVKRNTENCIVHIGTSFFYAVIRKLNCMPRVLVCNYDAERLNSFR